MAYVYFNGEKYFPILDFFSEDFLGLSEKESSYFQVDELMAIPVAYLNNKGYITDMSCSGHAIGKLCSEISDANDIEEFRKEGTFLAEKYLEEYENKYMSWVGEPSYGAFILFKKRISFSTIPEGWTYDFRCGRLSCNVASGRNPMTYYKNISVALESLMDWIMMLPSLQIE